MFRKALTTLAISATVALAAPAFAKAPPMKAPGERAVDTAHASGEEQGKAKGEQRGRSEHQDKHRGTQKHPDKHPKA